MKPEFRQITTGGIYEKTMNLRFVRRYEGTTEVRILQQALVCRETGDVDWQDVELIEGE